MTRRDGARAARGSVIAVLAVAVAPAVRAQTVLTLDEAMARARRDTPAARALSSASDEAGARAAGARSGYLPRVDASESVQRGDEPVFVFGSLLSQRRFTAADFDVASLNHPPALTNVRTALTADQTLFDGGLTRLRVRGAELDYERAALARTAGEQDLALAAAQAFVRVLQLQAADRANEAAVAAATSDLDRTRARRDTGVATDADVLAVEVHLADMRQRQIAAAGDLAVARIQLAEAAGLPLNETVTVLVPVTRAAGDPAALVSDALRLRPERQDADARVALAENRRRAARAAFLPTASVQAGWEFNGNTWTDQRSAWIVGARVQMNLFNGFADAARLAESRHAEARASAERDQLARDIEVQVRAAAARLEAARARQDAGRAAVMQARESQRIVRDRYDGGLATITDVLRAAEAVVDADARATAAEMDVILQNLALERAVGRL